MKIRYENTLFRIERSIALEAVCWSLEKFRLHLKKKKNGAVNASIASYLIRQFLKKKVGRFLNKPYVRNPYLELALSYLRKNPHMTIVDVGANRGTTVLPLAKQFPKSRVLAIEAHPLPASALLENCRLNKISNVMMLFCAIGMGKRFESMITSAINDGAHHLASFTRSEDHHLPSERISVPLFSLKEIFAAFDIKQCGILKVDVEGGDYDVLESLEEFLHPSVIHTLVVEYVPSRLRNFGKSAWDLAALPIRRGYDCFDLQTRRWIRTQEDLPTLKGAALDFYFQKKSS